MTKHQRQARIRQVRNELLAKIKENFPLVELLRTEEQPTGTVMIDVYAPYEDKVEILESVMDRVVELQLKEGLHIAILPSRQKPARRAA